MEEYIAYTDGSYQSSINAGGWSSIILDSNKNIVKKLYMGMKNTTNNRQELYAVINTLQYFSSPVKITIYSDSQYVINSIQTKSCYRWFENRDYDKKNLDLWYKLIDLLEFHDVSFIWVKGHNEDKYNEMADMLAVHAAQCLNIPEDVYNTIKI